MKSTTEVFNEALSALNARDLINAEKLFRQVLGLDEAHVPALNLLTVILMILSRFSEAEPLIAKAVKLNQSSDVSFYNYGLISKQLNKPKQALEQFSKAIELNPEIAETWNNRGTVYNELARYEAAISDFDQAISLKANYSEAYANKGKSLLALKRHDIALAAYDKALSIKTDLAEAWLGRGNVLTDVKRYDQALAAYDKALSIKTDLAEAWLGRGNLFWNLKRYEEALAAYDKALSFKSDLENAWLGRGDVYIDMKRYDAALAAYDKALSIKPDLEGAWLGRANVFANLKRYGEALAAYDKALSIKTDLAEAWLGRGHVLTDVKRYDQALAAYDKALSIKTDLENAWIGRGNLFWDLKRYEEALAAYDKALSTQPDLENAWLGRGNVFTDLKRYEEALAAYDKALSIKPDLENAWLGRGNVFWSVKRYDEALTAYDKALSIKPDLERAWFGRGNILFDLKRYDEAFAAYDTALKLKPDLSAAEGARLHAKMQSCDWSNFHIECRSLIDSVRCGKQPTVPFVLLTIEASAEDQFRYANAWVETNCQTSIPDGRSVTSKENTKIRIGYLSADLRNHAVAYLTAGVFEKHDKNRFETFAFSTGPDHKSDFRIRLKAAFNDFIDLHNRSDAEVADAIKSFNIDILIDLMGHTQDSRLMVLIRRPSPIQVNYLGYAGTVGGNNLDYIIADKTLIPFRAKKYYSEKIVYLPNSFMPHDRDGRIISDQVFDRLDFALSNNSIVFCCFNNAYKINPIVFQAWTTILKAVANAVLWLSDLPEIAKRNLQHEAQKQGIDPKRLIFARRLVSSSDHLARYRFADLFLDTLPYNAHTTASDALWAGLPVLTQMGETFAGRVSASLLNAVNLPELITHSREEYEALAIDLALNRNKLSNIKEKLNKNRLTTPLFDTALYTKHLEAAYEAMYRRYQAGLLPDHIEIQPIK